MYILFDIGGTKTRIARSDDLDSFETPTKYDTPQDFTEGIRVFKETADSLCRGEKIEGVAGGIRGVLNHEKMDMLVDPGGVLTGWEQKSLVDTVSTALDAPVFLENDTAIVGLGEACFGAGIGYDIVAYHTVSTGVGGVRIEQGVVDETANGFEPGHQILDLDGTVLSSKGEVNTLENLVSGGALEKRKGMKPYEIPQDDPVWDELAGYLAYGLNNTIVYWSPTIIVLGGSMIIGNPRILLKDIVRHTTDVLKEGLTCPPIVDATLKDEGGLYGAMALLKEKIA